MSRGTRVAPIEAKLRLRDLDFFVALAREKHFARAAKACGITQPTLSASVRKLEEDLGTSLVLRGNRFIGLTNEGEKVFTWGKQILNDYDGLRHELRSERNQLSGTLRLGIDQAAMPVLPVMTSGLCTTNPSLFIEARAMSSRAIRKDLETNDIDVGVTYLDSEPLERVRSLELYSEHYVFVVPRHHPLAGRSSVSWLEIVDEKLCLVSEAVQSRRIMDRIVASLGSALRPRIISDSFTAVSSHVRLGQWCSIVPHTFAHELCDTADLVAIELVEPAHSASMGLVVSDHEPRSAMAQSVFAFFLTINLEAELVRAVRGKNVP